MTLLLNDKVALITGANAGLGYQLSMSFARMGAQVVMACRSPQRADRALEQLRAEVPGAKLTVLPLDLADPASILGFGALVNDRVGRLDLVVHNAGVFGVPLARNREGHELHFATNYLGPFALTGVLTPLVRDAHGSRIVFVGSLAHRLFKLRLEQLTWQQRYNKWAAYGLSKLALMAYALELNRRLKRQGSKVIVVGAHPGFAPTEGAFAMTAANYKSALGQWWVRTIAPLLPTVAKACAPILHAATDRDVVGGDYFGPSGFLEIVGATGRARLAAQAHDAALALALWQHSEQLTGVRYLSDEPAAREPATLSALG
jgi:NAD(P)-dependent dehydrogenase (short-subunit alcohol dehydrogenase family)